MNNLLYWLELLGTGVCDPRAVFAYLYNFKMCQFPECQRKIDIAQTASSKKMNSNVNHVSV